MLFWIVTLSACLVLAMWAQKDEKQMWAIAACFVGLLAYTLYPAIVEVEGSSAGLWPYAVRMGAPTLFIFAFACVFARALADMFDWTVSEEEREIQVAFAPRKK